MPNTAIIYNTLYQYNITKGLVDIAGVYGWHCIKLICTGPYMYIYEPSRHVVSIPTVPVYL